MCRSPTPGRGGLCGLGPRSVRVLLGGAPLLRSGTDTVAWLDRLDDRRQLSDLALAVAWLRQEPSVDAGRVGVVGFSIGGRYAMLLGAEPHGLAAVVSLYTRPWPGGSVAETALAPGDHVDAWARRCAPSSVPRTN